MADTPPPEDVEGNASEVPPAPGDDRPTAGQPQPPAETHHHHHSGSQELARRPVTHEVLTPLDPQAQKRAMEAYQEGLKAILDRSDWQEAGSDGSFVKKSGWRKIAAWFNLSIEYVSDSVERDDAGQVQRAKVIARAVAPNGRFADGDGYCDIQERRFNRNKGKLENDLRGTAATRAVNRAVSNLVGMGAVSAEETDEGQDGPGFGRPMDEETLPRLKEALGLLLDAGDGPDAEGADELIVALQEDAGGYMPRIVARALLYTAARLKANVGSDDVPAEEPPADAAPDTDEKEPQDGSSDSSSD